MASTTSTISTPSLEKPGAGIPWIERKVGGIFLRRLIKRYDYKTTDERLLAEAESALRLAAQCDSQLAGRPVLIRRIRGIEDSSRNWSVYMTLDHLRIVNDGIARVIALITEGKTPSHKTRIEDVKPSPTAGEDTIAEFEESVRKLREVCHRGAEGNQETTHDHPWFGPLNFKGWHAMAAMHIEIHRRQLEHILKALE